MIPTWWTGVVIALGVFRVWRLIGWDDFPLAVKVRVWLVGAELVASNVSANAAMKITNEPDPAQEWRYRRPQLAHMIQCSYCLGFWLSAGAYVWWVFSPTSCLYAMVPFGLSGAVGIIGARLDP